MAKGGPITLAGDMLGMLSDSGPRNAFGSTWCVA